jgi:hypothetical protein
MDRKRQGSLFESPELGDGEYLESSLNILGRLKEAMRRMAEASRFSRTEIVDRMNARALQEGILSRRGRRYSLAQVDAWLAKSKNNQPDVESLGLFCWAAEGREALKVSPGSLGAVLVDRQAAQLLAWARNELAIKKLLRDRKRLEPEL